MTKGRSIRTAFVIASVAMAFTFLTPQRAAGRFEAFSESDSTRKRMQEVADAVQVDRWPRSDVLRLAPPLEKNLLVDPCAVTRESIHYSTERFKDNTAVEVRWGLDCVIDNPNGVPSELPPDYRDRLLSHLTGEQRKDPNFVKERLKRALELYKRSSRSKVAGSLMVDVCRAPDANTAQEFLISLRSNTQMPTEGIVWDFSTERRIEGLGDVAFNRGWLMFVRDNIAVAIRGEGQLEQEAMILAKKMDAMIQKQPVLKKEQLQLLRPVVSIADSGRRADARTHLVDYSVSVPGNQEIASLQAYVIDARGRNGAPIADGKIRVMTPSKAAKIRVEAITTGMLANAAERDVKLLDDSTR
jgi:hypothetical protein